MFATCIKTNSVEQSKTLYYMFLDTHSSKQLTLHYIHTQPDTHTRTNKSLDSPCSSITTQFVESHSVYLQPPSKEDVRKTVTSVPTYLHNTFISIISIVQSKNITTPNVLRFT